MNLRALAADPTQIPDAIARAASASGIDFSYLLHQAQAESGLNPTAHARTSSAAGLFQFIDSTWMSVIKQHGAANGLGWAADAVQWIGGKLRIADPTARAAVMALRQDPQASASMAAAYAADNKAGLEARLGRAVGAADLALAHFRGLGGATKFLRALAADPGAAAASAAAPHVAHANHAVFFAHDGAARTLGQVYERVAARFTGSAAPPVAAAPVQYAEAGPVPGYARAAYLMLAELGG